MDFNINTIFLKLFILQANLQLYFNFKLVDFK